MAYRIRVRTLMLGAAALAAAMAIGRAMAPANVGPVLPFVASLLITGVCWVERKAEGLPVNSVGLMKIFLRVTFVCYSLIFLLLCLAFAFG